MNKIKQKINITVIIIAFLLTVLFGYLAGVNFNGVNFRSMFIGFFMFLISMVCGIVFLAPIFLSDREKFGKNFTKNLLFLELY